MIFVYNFQGSVLNFLYFLVIDFSAKMPHQRAVIKIAFNKTIEQKLQCGHQGHNELIFVYISHIFQ